MAAFDDDELNSLPPLSLRDGSFGANRLSRPWSWRLGLFLGALAAAEIAKGLFHWSVLIGAGGAAEPLAGHSVPWFLTTTFFAVVDPVAGVGLWVGARWGVAIWLIAALGQIVASAADGPTGPGWTIIAATIAAMTAYVALSMKSRDETV